MAAGAGAWVRPFRSGWRVYFRLAPGEKLHGKAGFTTFEDAEKWAADARAKITTKRRTVGDAVDAYEDALQARVARNEMRASSAREAVAGCRKLMAEVLDYSLGMLTPRRAQEAYEAYANKKGVAVGTQHQAIKVARTFGEWCAKRGWFKASPFASVDKIGERDDSRDVSLRVDEARAYRETAVKLARKGDTGALTALIALTCSLNPSEIVQIAGRDIDDDGAVLWIAGRRLKTKNRRRQIAIADEELRDLLVAAAARVPKSEPLFPYDRVFVTRAAKRIAKTAKVPVVDARALRRTFAALDARRGSSLDSLAFNMGHGADSKARTARQHYVAHGAIESGAARRVLGVLDGGKRAKRRTMLK